MTRIRTHASRGLFIIALLIGGLAALPAAADHDRGRGSGRDPVFAQCNTPPVHVIIRDPVHRAPIRTPAQIDRERGECDGQRVGYRAGFDDGYRGLARHCECRIDLGCVSRAYERGFREGFERGYEAGYCAGLAQRERERDRFRCGTVIGHGHGHFQIRIGW